MNRNVPISPESLIMNEASMLSWRNSLIEAGRKLVFTNGCFDLMHRGHAHYLFQARSCGDALVVALNSDRSIRELKGPERPIIDEFSRAYMLASLKAVDAVIVFDTLRCTRLLDKIKPDIYVKGGDYTVDKLDPEERQQLLADNVDIRFIPFIDGFSTTQLLAKIANHA